MVAAVNRSTRAWRGPMSALASVASEVRAGAASDVVPDRGQEHIPTDRRWSSFGERGFLQQDRTKETSSSHRRHSTNSSETLDMRKRDLAKALTKALVSAHEDKDKRQSDTLSPSAVSSFSSYASTGREVASFSMGFSRRSVSEHDISVSADDGDRRSVSEQGLVKEERTGISLHYIRSVKKPVYSTGSADNRPQRQHLSTDRARSHTFSHDSPNSNSGKHTPVVSGSSASLSRISQIFSNRLEHKRREREVADQKRALAISTAVEWGEVEAESVRRASGNCKTIGPKDGWHKLSYGSKFKMFQSEGEKHCLLAHYAPRLFDHMRLLSGISRNSFTFSMCNKPLVGVGAGAGKSGARFFQTYDGRYVVKTVPKTECDELRKMLYEYYQYLVQNKDSLLPRFLGMYKVKLGDQACMRVVVQRNIFYTQLPIHRRFDLKGSKVGRGGNRRPSLTTSSRTDSFEMDIFDQTLKDNDMDGYIAVPSSSRTKLILQAEKDADFLCGHKLMDYSLLLGLYRHNPENEDISLKTVRDDEFNQIISNALMRTLHDIIHLYLDQKGVRVRPPPDYQTVKRQLVAQFGAEEFESNKQDVCAALEELSYNDVRVLPYWNKTRGGMRAYFAPHATEAKRLEPVVVFLAVIDVLQIWNAKKKGERMLKQNLVEPLKGKGAHADISAIEPARYKTRFIRMLTERIRPFESHHATMLSESNCGVLNQWFAIEEEEDGVVRNDRSSYDSGGALKLL